MDYIKLSRKILEWEWWDDINTSRVFIFMLLKANWKDGKFKGVDVPRGSFVSSLQKISLGTGLTVDEVRTAVKHLKATDNITSKSHSKFTVFTVKNYGRFQDIPKQEASQKTSTSQPVPDQFPTIEEGKKERKEKNNISAYADYKPAAAEDNIFAVIRELYNSVCGSYPRLVKMSERRKKAVRARINAGYTVDDFKLVFEKAEHSLFLKGGNDRDWCADFDWMIKDDNMAKILEGKYDHVKAGNTMKSGTNNSAPRNRFNNFHQREYDFGEYEKQLLDRGQKGGG